MTIALGKKSTSLLIIDMQNDFVLPGAPQCVAGAMAVIPNIRKVLAWFRRNSLPVFHVVREYRADGSDIEITRLADFLKKEKYCIPGTKGCEIVDELKPTEGEYRIVKPRFSAFMNTELDFMLRRLGVTHIVVCGIQYPNCIRATIFDGVSYGYDVTLVTDATGAQTEEVARANIYDIANIGVRCMSTEEFLKVTRAESG
ncbi:MAG: cysteine hydrolase [Kiritimatiellae bacterium]|nr:cysteine hydrolase [Kiritimatiellia bacterium]